MPSQWGDVSFSSKHTLSIASAMLFPGQQSSNHLFNFYSSFKTLLQKSSHQKPSSHALGGRATVSAAKGPNTQGEKLWQQKDPHHLPSALWCVVRSRAQDPVAHFWAVIPADAFTCLCPGLLGYKVGVTGGSAL